jgi:hypothetical protein
MYTPTVISLLLTCLAAQSGAAAWRAHHPNRRAKDVFGDDDFYKLHQLTNNIAKVVGKKSRSLIILYGKVMKNIIRFILEPLEQAFDPFQKGETSYRNREFHHFALINR